MILQCPQCSTKFRLDDSLLLPDGRQVACSKCNNQWFAQPPENPNTENSSVDNKTDSTADNPSATNTPTPQPTTPPQPSTAQDSTTVPEKKDDLSPLDNDNSKPDFAMGDDITERLARIRQSVQPKSDTAMGETETQTPPPPPPPSEPTPEPQQPSPPSSSETPTTPQDSYSTVEGYGINDGAVFEKTPQPPVNEPTGEPLEEAKGEEAKEEPAEIPKKVPTEEPVVKDIQDFESALSKASKLAEMAELKDQSDGTEQVGFPPPLRDATTGETITADTDVPSDVPNDTKTAKAQNVILQTIRDKKDSLKAKQDERPSHVQRSKRSWLTQIIILLCVILGLGVISLLVAKNHVMDMFPETRPYYALVGAKVSSVGKGLVILEPTASISEKNGVKKLTISGTVENRLDTEEPLPLLLAQVKGMNGEVLVQWTFKGQQTTIPPKGKVTYSTSITDPSTNANSVAVTIANLDKNTPPITKGNTVSNKAKKIGDAPKATPLKKDSKKDGEEKKQ